MDKHEYRVKTEQMLDYMAKKQYKKAMEIADTIDWHRVKSLSMLSSVSEIYEYNGENQKSRDILFIAYDRSSGSRKIVYRLGTLAIKINDLQEAMDCYEEFLSIAPKDPNQYILKYKILKAENAPLEEQIEALVDFKKMEYVEKWAYELAKLYEEAGMIVECLEECDDLILWFSEGKYVLKAMELKMKHKPLTPLQQEKYDRFVQKKEEAKRAKENLEATRKIELSKEVIESIEKEPEEKQEEKVEEPEQKQEEEVKEPEEKQEEEIKEPEEKQEEEVKEPEKEQEEEVKEPEKEQEEEVEEPEKEQEEESIIKETVVGSTLEEAVAKGVAVAVNVTARQSEEESMSAQEKLEGILQNWEETQRTVEQEIERKKQQAEAEREARRKERVEQNMFNTTPIIPDDIQQLLDDLEKEMKESETANVEIDEVAQEVEPIEQESVQEESIQKETVEEVIETEEPIEEITEEPVEEIEKEVEEESATQSQEAVVSDFVEDFADDDDIIEKQFDISFQEEEEKEKDEALEQLQNEMTTETNEETEGVSFDTGFIVQGKYDLEAQSEIGLKAGLTEEQKKLFSYFVPVRGMSEQIVEVLENDKNCNTRYGTSRTGNILVVGRQGTGKTVLAVNVVKAIQKARRLKQGKVAIVTGDALNRKDLSTVLGKLKGGALIVEKAGKMNQDTIEELNERMEEQTGELLVVLEEQRKPLEKLLSENAGFRRKFTSKLELPIFINDELVTFGQTYAKENGYKIDEMGILALYSRIDILQKEDHAVTVTEVKEIIDHAIEKAQRVNLKHFFKRLFGKHTDNADRVILTEQDFK